MLHSRPRSSALTALLSVATALALVGCGQRGDQEKKITQAEAGICTELARIDTALEQAAALTPESTVGDVKKVRTELRDAMRALVPYEKELEQARYREYDEKGKAVRLELKSIEEDPQLTLAQASERLQTKVQAAIAAHEALSAGVDCPAG